MNAYRRLAVGLSVLSVMGAASILWAQATTQPAESPADNGQVGYVDGNNVYVRSGFHQNYYPVTKLNRGDKVVILGEEFGWLKIEPPVGTYSLVEKGYIDKSNDKEGVTNDRVWVHAGSNLNDRRYARQVQLPAGTKVALIGETPDGAYYKIEPPQGAALWIKGDFVDRTGRLADAAASTARTAPPLEPVPPGELGIGGEAARSPATRPSEAAEAARPVPPSPQQDRPSSEHQLEMNAIEAMIAAEGTKPFESRSYEEILARLETLAEQAGQNEVVQIYAQTRIEQLKGQMEVIAAVRELETLKEQTIDEADRLAAMRARIRVEEAKPMDDTVVRGEIRVSGLYDGNAGRPKRWRIVGREGTPQAGRTLAYLEVEPGSTIDPVQYYGKYVGVRATGRRMLEGTIPPVPIYTIREINVLDPNRPEEITRAAMASPPATNVAPATQPTASEKGWTPISEPPGGEATSGDANEPANEG